MAKRLIDWNLKGSVLVMGKYIDSETPATELERFNILDLFPEFEKMNDVQQFLIVYGLKQKLADTGSAEKDAYEKAKLAKDLFELFVSGKYQMPRVNATGAKENKAIVAKAKEKANVVSLEGLITKKTVFPDTFTDEDQAKLDEFLAMVAGHGKKNK